MQNTLEAVTVNPCSKQMQDNVMLPKFCLSSKTVDLSPETTIVGLLSFHAMCGIDCCCTFSSSSAGPVPTQSR